MCVCVCGGGGGGGGEGGRELVMCTACARVHVCMNGRRGGRCGAHVSVSGERGACVFMRECACGGEVTNSGVRRSARGGGGGVRACVQCT